MLHFRCLLILTICYLVVHSHASDVDECETGSPCHPNASCINTDGSYQCTCKTGYAGSGTICTDLNECYTVRTCDPNASCINTDGSYQCTCKTGYAGSGTVCTDLDECVTGSPCDPNASCINTDGSYQCTCKTGYAGSGTICTATATTTTTTTTTASPPLSCAEGWSLYQAGKKCLKVFSDKLLAWKRARESCQCKGGDLVKITDQDMMTFVQGLKCPNLCWIGLHDKSMNGTWKWLNDKEPASFTFWDEGQPEKCLIRKDYCVEMNELKAFRWKNRNCWGGKNYICQLDA